MAVLPSPENAAEKPLPWSGASGARADKFRALLAELRLCRRRQQGDRDPVSVAGQIGEDSVGSAKRRPGID